MFGLSWNWLIWFLTCLYISLFTTILTHCMPYFLFLDLDSCFSPEFKVQYIMQRNQCRRIMNQLFSPHPQPRQKMEGSVHARVHSALPSTVWTVQHSTSKERSFLGGVNLCITMPVNTIISSLISPYHLQTTHDMIL